MKYISTRGAAEPASFCDVLLAGLAPDGGLYLPEEYPHLDTDTLTAWRSVLATQGYPALAAAVLECYVDDIPADDLRGICERAYTAAKFGHPRIVSLDGLGGGLLLGHLSQGPTAAFKDMAMQLLGELFEYELDRRDTALTIVGATSGDTGSAAEHAMLGKDRVRVFMLTPAGRMSPFQQAQMFSIDDPRITNIAVDGVFDDCQDLVKAVNADATFKKRHRIGAVNSINWARLVAQVVYYIALWLEATETNNDRVTFAVPSGNFGNICAGHIAREMGLPIDTLVLATNENNVLAEFFATGSYRVRGSSETRATSSPSMDISKASNFERFVFDLLGRDGARTAELFGDELATTGSFDLSGTAAFTELRARFGFVAGTSTHADRITTIAGEYARTRTVIDPHTADAVHVARGLVAAGEVGRPVIALETALPVKFSATIVEALGQEVPRPERFVGLEDLPRRVVDLANDVDALRALIEQASGA
ncbi:MAG: threonine synthase [Propioniciclava sp.]